MNKYHYTELGRFGEAVKMYADLDGFVPLGGKPEDYRWAHPVEEWTAEMWKAHLGLAEQATKTAEQELDEWRTRPSSS